MVKLLESPEKRITQVFRRADALEEKALRDQLRLITQIRKWVMEELVDASGYQSFHLTQLLNAIDSYIDRVQSDSASLLSSDTANVFSLGQEVVDAPLKAAGIDLGFGDSLVGVSSDLLHSAITLTTGSMSDVFDGLGAGIKSSIRRAALGAESPADVMAAAAKMLAKDGGPFAKAANSADLLVRTGVNQIFSSASFARMNQSNKAMGGALKKWWLTAEDDRVRDDHVDAGDTYDEDGAIPVDEMFEVGGEKMRFPLDPNASPDQVYRCRCRLCPKVPGASATAEDDSTTTAAADEDAAA